MHTQDTTRAQFEFVKAVVGAGFLTIVGNDDQSIHTHIHTYTHTYIHIYTNVCTHTNIHIYIHAGHNKSTV